MEKMTEGIIQKVLDNYMINHDIRPSIINSIKQELIAEIKNHAKEVDTPYYTGLVLVSWLIGDNE